MKKPRHKVLPVSSDRWRVYSDRLVKLLDPPVSTQDLYKTAAIKHQWAKHFSVNVLAWSSLNTVAVFSFVYRVWHLPGADLSGLIPKKALADPGVPRGKSVTTRRENVGDSTVVCVGGTHPDRGE